MFALLLALPIRKFDSGPCDLGAFSVLLKLVLLVAVKAAHVGNLFGFLNVGTFQQFWFGLEN